MPGEVYVPGEPVRLPRKGQVFVGPTIGTGTRRCSARFAAEFVAQLHAAGQAVLVQPGGSGDETVLVFLGGEPSHAFTKQADAAPDRARLRNLGRGCGRRGRRGRAGGC